MGKDRHQPPTLQLAESSNGTNKNADSLNIADSGSKGKKKAGRGARLWMKFDRLGNSEAAEYDKRVIIQRTGIPSRDLRILGPVFSNCSHILAREKAMVVSLEFVRAIVTAEEVLIFDPLRQDILPFVDQLRQQLPGRSAFKLQQGRESGEGLRHEHEHELPFEFQVLEIALEVVCTYLDSGASDLEKDAYPMLDELVRHVNTNNLELVRSLKGNLTRLLARVQQVRDEIEHLLDHNEDMAGLYLTRKWIQNHQQSEALLDAPASNSNSIVSYRPRVSSKRSTRSMVTASHSIGDDVEDLEMLLEAYFVQLEGIKNKILLVREYIDDTEDYVNIQLDNRRNQLIQFRLKLYSVYVPVGIETLIVGLFSINIPCSIYSVNGIFGYFTGGTLTGCFLVFMLLMGYAKWKKLLD